MTRHTKIVCTLGPSCEDQAILEKMIDAGMDVARLNFSHGAHADHQARIAQLRALSNRPASRSPSCRTCRVRSCASVSCPRKALN